jgi:hypothetical protein
MNYIIPRNILNLIEKWEYLKDNEIDDIKNFLFPYIKIQNFKILPKGFHSVYWEIYIMKDLNIQYKIDIRKDNGKIVQIINIEIIDFDNFQERNAYIKRNMGCQLQSLPFHVKNYIIDDNCITDQNTNKTVQLKPYSSSEGLISIKNANNSKLLYLDDKEKIILAHWGEGFFCQFLALISVDPDSGDTNIIDEYFYWNDIPYIDAVKIENNKIYMYLADNSIINAKTIYSNFENNDPPLLFNYSVSKWELFADLTTIL